MTMRVKGCKLIGKVYRIEYRCEESYTMKLGFKKGIMAVKRRATRRQRDTLDATVT